MIFGAILAGGIGKRMENYKIPKQFIAINGTPIIIHTLRQFINNKNFDAIYVAVHNDWIIYTEDLLKKEFSLNELKKIIIIGGGKERLDSFTNILNEIVDKYGINDNDILICHDSVRPFVTQKIIDECIETTLKDSFALTVVPVTDTIHVACDEEYIDNTLERKNLYNGQTPSGFRINLLKKILDSSSEQDKALSTGTTQLVLKAGHKIRIVKGHTSNFKITTDNDLDIAERVLQGQNKTRKIELLDCTLRDGGIAIDFNFGLERMQIIKKSLEDAGVNLIECGYIDQKKGSPIDRTCFNNELSIENTLLQSKKKENVQYVAMIDYGTFDLQTLHDRHEAGIDGIRFAFHKEFWKDAIRQAKTILEKGYDLYIQPMVTLRYSDEEFRELIEEVNTSLPQAKAFYIVDSFGQMDGYSLLRKISIADQYVSSKMKIGFHAHNNRQLAFSNTCELIKSNTKHDIMLDCSIMGMGKGAGNLCTELIMPILIAEGGNYCTTGIYSQISEYFSKEIIKHPWGYCLDYYLSSIYGCTPSYIKIFNKDCRVTTDILIALLRNMPENKKVACDRVFAQEYLEKFFAED